MRLEEDAGGHGSVFRAQGGGEASVGRLDEATGGAEGERRTGGGKACLALDLIVSQGWL